MELYSKRRKALDSSPTSLRYDLPIEFRNQVVFIWNSSAGYTEASAPFGQVAPDDMENMAISVANQFFDKVRRDFCEVHGVLELPGSVGFETPCQSLRRYFQICPDDEAIDIIELTFNEILQAQNGPNFSAYIQPEMSATEATRKLNDRLKEHAIGFRFEDGMMVRIDSEFLHAETTEPALRLMHAGGFAGAIEEFQLAHEHYRHRRYDDCLTNCLKALESTLQKIIESREWKMPGEPKFDNLFAEVKNKGLFPSFLSSHLGELKKFLQAVAVIRNEEGAHGAGSAPNEVPDHLAAYQIHLTGSAIVFLIRCDENFGKSKS